MPDRLDDIYTSLKRGSQKYMVEIDMDGRIIGYSADALGLLGYTKAEMEELTVFDLVTDLELLMESFEKRPKAKQEYDITIIAKSGKKIPVKVNPEVILKNKEIDTIKCHFRLKS